MPLKDELDVEVNGRDVITGLPKTVRIESEEIRRALNKPLDEMAKPSRTRSTLRLPILPRTLCTTAFC